MDGFPYNSAMRNSGNGEEKSRGCAVMEQFHFAEPGWFWLLLFLPLWWWRSGRFESRANKEDQGVEAFADRHLLPYLLARGAEGARREEGAPHRFWKTWAAMAGFVGVVLALAGPRWEFDEVTVYQPDAALMVVVDLSRSMDADDVPPSRMARARQELSDLLDRAREEGMHVGLIGFAAEPHVLSPLTSDVRTIKDLLHVVDTSLLQIQGSDPAEALELARRQLEHYGAIQGGANQHILLLTDGDLEERWEEVGDFAGALKKKQEEGGEGIRLHAMAVGTKEGKAVPDGQGYYVKGPDGKVHVSRMDAGRLKAIAAEGGGVFVEANFRRDDTEAVMQAVGTRAGEGARTTSFRQWKEAFIYPLLLGMVCLVVVLL